MQLLVKDRAIQLGYYVGFIGIQSGNVRWCEISLALGLVVYEYKLDLNVCNDPDGTGIGTMNETTNLCRYGSQTIDHAEGRLVLPMYGGSFVLFTGQSDFGIFTILEIITMMSPANELKVKWKSHGTMLMNYSDSTSKIVTYTYLF